MSVWHRIPRGISANEAGAGVVAATATLPASVIYWASLWAFVPAVEVPFSVELSSVFG